MTRPLAPGALTVMTGNAGTANLAMIDLGNRNPCRGVMTSLTLVAG